MTLWSRARSLGVTLLIVLAGTGAFAGDVLVVLVGRPVVDFRVDHRGFLHVLEPGRTIRCYAPGLPDSALTTATLAPGPSPEGWAAVTMELRPAGGTYVLERRADQGRILAHDGRGNLLARSPDLSLGEAMIDGPLGLARTASGDLLVGVAGGVDRLPADLSSRIPAFRCPAMLSDLFAPAGIWPVSEDSFLVVDTSACTVWQVSPRAPGGWAMGARGRALGQFIRPLDLSGGGPGHDRGYLVDRDGETTHVVVLDSNGVIHTRLDGTRADRVRAGPNGELYVHDGLAMTITQFIGLDSHSAVAQGLPSEEYAKLPGLLARSDPKALDQWRTRWSALPVSATVRLAVFRALAQAGHRDLADQELDQALVELPGRYDALLEGMGWAQRTRRPTLASELFKRHGWTISDAAEYRQLTLLEQEIKEQVSGATLSPTPSPSMAPRSEDESHPHPATQAPPHVPGVSPSKSRASPSPVR